MHFSTPELLGSILVLLTPLGGYLAVRSLIIPRRGGPARERRVARFARVFVFVPLAVFVVFSLTHRVKLNWTGPLWLAAIPGIAALLAASADAAERGRWIRRLWLVTVVVMGAGYLGFLQYLTAGLPGIGYSRQIALLPVGWSELGREVERIEQGAEAAVGRDVKVVGMDKNFIASETAFYQPDQAEGVTETTGAHLFGARSLMFERWSPRSESVGDTLLLVGLRRSQVERRAVRKHGEAGPVHEHWLSRGGKRIAPFYTRLVTDYREDRAE